MSRRILLPVMAIAIVAAAGAAAMAVPRLPARRNRRADRPRDQGTLEAHGSTRRGSCARAER